MSAYGTAFPATTGTSLTWSNNEVQTITKAGTWTSGTYTLEVVYPDGTSETTAEIALDADAATVKAALAALDNLTADDLTVTGGGLSTTPLVVTFGGAWANTAMPLILVGTASLVGGGTATAVHTAVGRLWTELPTAKKVEKLKRIHKTDSYVPQFAMGAQDSITTELSLSDLKFTIHETDLDALNIGLPSSLLATTPPGAGQVGMETLTSPSAEDIDDTLVQFALVYTGPDRGGFGQIRILYCCKRVLDEDVFAEQGKSRDLPLHFEVFNDPNHDDKPDQWLQYTLPAAS
jgi:hypothetical protein